MFLSFERKYKKQVLETGLHSLKNCCKNQSIKQQNFYRNKNSDAVTKSNDHKIVELDENPRNIEEIIIPPEKRDEVLNKLRKVL